MGQVIPIIKALGCHDCARYVCNACHVKSKCSDCCELDVDTDAIEVKSQSSESFDADCCGNRIHANT